MMNSWCLLYGHILFDKFEEALIDKLSFYLAIYYLILREFLFMFGKVDVGKL